MPKYLIFEAYLKFLKKCFRLEYLVHESRFKNVVIVFLFLLFYPFLLRILRFKIIDSINQYFQFSPKGHSIDRATISYDQLQ